MNKEYQKADEYISNVNIKKEIQEACFNFLENAQLNVNTMTAASLFLFFALKYNDKKMAKPLLTFTKLDVNFEKKPWNYESDHETKYNALRYLAGM